MRKFLCAQALFLAMGTSLFASGISLGDPSYGGSGCPQGSASATLSPDATALTILFDNYVAEAGGFSGKTIDRKTCNIAIPVHVPQGKSVSLFTIDYRGFNSVPLGAYATFNAEYFFAGMAGPRFERRFNGRFEDQYMIRDVLPATAVVWSRCGDDVILRANTSITARTNRQREDVYTAVDTADIQAGLVYHLAWKDC